EERRVGSEEDRGGEAIAWHLLEELKPRVPARRMVFHEITPQAIAEAVAHPRDLDLGLVDAYQTRRVLDRLYGYEVSPVLWKKVMPRLSAGRVQAVATRLIVARERERIAFRPSAYWDLEAIFTPVKETGDDVSSFPGRLTAVDGRRVAQGRDFSPGGELRNSGLLYLEGAAPAAGDRPPAAGASPGRRPDGRPHHVKVGRAKAVPPLPVRAVPHHDPPAGSLPQAGLLRQVHDVHGAAAVRERPHHLHADRLN